MIPTYKDVSTVFSIAPFELNETKPGLYPGNFQLPACTDQKKPLRLLVKSSVNLMTIGGKRRPIPTDTASAVVAASIVNDCISAQLYSGPGCGPGLCWLPGDVSIETFLKDYKDIYDALIVQQKRWFIARCKHVDDEWARHKTHRVASDIDRFAARTLGLNPEWIQADDVFSFNKCGACGTMNDKDNAICSNCFNVLNADRAKTFTFANTRS